MKKLFALMVAISICLVFLSCGEKPNNGEHPCFKKGDFAISKLSGAKVFIVRIRHYTFQDKWIIGTKRMNRNGETIREDFYDWELICDQTYKTENKNEDRY